MARRMRPVDVDLDDVPAVDALLDPGAHLADQDRRRQCAVDEGDRRVWRLARHEAAACASIRSDASVPGRGAGPGWATIGSSPTTNRPARAPRSVTPEAPRVDRRRSTSRSTQPSCTSWASCATSDTEPKKFREVVRELSWLLGYEALADAGLRPLDVETPIETMQGAELADRIGLIPILRAGLGMVDAMLELMPTAQVWHLGLFRDERTLRPVEYYNKLPDSATVDLCLILDPMLATGGSATAAIEVLKKWGAVRIKLVNLIAAPEGVAAVLPLTRTSRSSRAALDRQLNEKGYIMPGLGDAGDRQFGTGGAAR